MRVLKVIFATLVVGLLVVPATVSAYTGSVWIEYAYSTNSAQGAWKVPNYTEFRPSMLGSWDSWTNSAKSGPMRNLYCIEANVYEPLGGWHEHQYDLKSTFDWVPPQGGTNLGLQWAAHLITQFDPYMNTTSTLTRAALQLSIWEALYDYGVDYAAPVTASCFDANAGAFWINSITGGGVPGNNFTAAQVKAQAVVYLNNKGLCNYGQVLHDGQDLLKVDVPEPGSLMLLGGVLLGAAGMAWRRRSRS